MVRVSTQTEPIVELVALQRPFPPLKSLDMDDVIVKVKKALTQEAKHDD